MKVPELKVGDEVLVGKWKNKLVTIEGFGKDKHGQPTMKTSGGEYPVFHFRLKRLMKPEKDESMNKTDQLLSLINEDTEFTDFEQWKAACLKLGAQKFEELDSDVKAWLNKDKLLGNWSKDDAKGVVYSEDDGHRTHIPYHQGHGGHRK